MIYIIAFCAQFINTLKVFFFAIQGLHHYKGELVFYKILNHIIVHKHTTFLLILKYLLLSYRHVPIFQSLNWIHILYQCVGLGHLTLNHFKRRGQH